MHKSNLKEMAGVGFKHDYDTMHNKIIICRKMLDIVLRLVVNLLLLITTESCQITIVESK